MHQLGEIVDELALRVTPGEISVALGEPSFSQRLHHFRFCECFGKKKHVRIWGVDAGNEIFPEGNWLGVRIIDPKDAHTVVRPKKDNALHLDPKRAPVFAAEIKRIYVLVLLWWILSVFDRAVGPLVEPVGMLLNVRMIG